MTPDLAERIARDMGIDATRRASLVLVARKDVERFLDGCRRAGVRVLGIEGFTIENDELIPDMDAIGDFSDSVYSGDEEAVLHDARAFFEVAGRADLWFDFELVQTDGPSAR